MPGGTRRAKKPSEYVIHGSWPNAVIESRRAAQIAQTVSRRLAEAMTRQGLSANALAKASGVNRQVIANILAGQVWIDTVTLADLEEVLDEMLWPQHVAWPRNPQGEALEPLSE
ncbi:helix-turn-helix domain-containing protein [Streptomyces sp. DSM 116496]|uniref:helix-turn-helix domain-containing protein n=1 Tax=Streptomyces stoeckheimensis TaxID=3344656 RepID=UPI0038B25829